ncbi:ER lumen protein retaining receptor-domain-containing protein [Tribonema minus]|uniref:ER lumen protein retaining receptor-domain-containing protein n=1 Tax=Tribonema minus TaxID=303371 RepID=A0A835Z6E1_9STRA|nr:ER lumen protein retaining receptor-domain-containing protein [Tribonema minus]
MNIFRLVGDLCHLASILLLLLKLRASKNASGISLKTQELFLAVFVCRYLDLFTTFYSVYNSVMKVLYIALTALIIHMMRAQSPIRGTYDASQDTFLHVKYAVAPCAALAALTMLVQGFDVRDLFWNFSIYLEAIAIVPQLIVLQRYREVENLTGHYIFFLGAYRALYILNWIYRSFHERGYKHHYVVYFAGIVQTALYVDFFYYYAISKYRGGKFSLPS